MIKKARLASALAVAFSATPVLAEDSHALSLLHATPGLMQDTELGAPKKAATCDFGSVDRAGGFSLCAWLEPGASSGKAHFKGSNELPVTRARFLQVVN